MRPLHLVAPTTLPRRVTAIRAAQAIRAHWGIENTSHHSRDVTMGEDRSRIRTNPGVFARLRSFAPHVLQIGFSATDPTALNSPGGGMFESECAAILGSNPVDIFSVYSHNLIVAKGDAVSTFAGRRSLLSARPPSAGRAAQGVRQLG